MKKVDLHIHSEYSDGSNTIQELIEVIKRENIEIFALTDHDTAEGCLEMAKYVPSNIKFIPGIELTCQADTIKCHILGFNCNPKDVVLNNLVQKGKILRKNKLETRIKHLKEVWNINLTPEELDWLYSRNSVVKIHVGNILVKRGLAKDNIEAMNKYLTCKTGNSRFNIDEALEAITKSGGTPVWAHPLGGEGEVHSTKEEFLPKLEKMIAFGIKGLECYYSRYSMEEIEFLVQCAKENNLLISGGSDYHGTNKNVPIARLNTQDIPIYSDKLTLLDKISS